ncbi:MAG: TonB-dependent receptor [Novosphingobium sp.]
MLHARSYRISRNLVGGSSVLALAMLALFPASARAQDAAQGAEQDADGSEGFGQDIIVTANKREQSLAKVGLSISAFDSTQLENQRISEVSDLAKITPGLAVAPSPTATPVYTLRGIGFYEQSLAAYPAVSLYIDQAPLALPVMASKVPFDLERVEVLKGPQGTLFGNNSTGGAINFVAAKPTDVFSAGAQLSYGRFNTIEVNGFVSGPLSDTVKARVAFRAASGDDWQKSYTRIDGGVPAEFLAVGVPDSTLRKQDTLGQTKNIAGRFLLDWEASDRLRLSLNVNGWRNQDDPQAPQYYKPRLQYPVGTMGPAGFITGGVQADIPIGNYPAAPHNARATDWNPDLRPEQDNKFWQVTVRGDYDLTDSLTLTSLSGYSHLDFYNITESDGTALNTFDIAPDIGLIKSFTTELRIANDSHSRARFTIGANYEHTQADELAHFYVGDTTTYYVNGFTGNTWGSNQRMNNYALFGNIEYDVIDQVTLKGGIRQTKAKRSALMIGPYETDGYYPTGAFGPNSLTTFFNAAYGAIYGGAVAPIAVGDPITLDTRVNADGTPVDPSTYLKTGNPTGKLDEDSTSWSLGVDYKPTSELLLYANVSKGYKAGSFPTLAGAIYAAYAPVVQESLLDYEVGFKAQLLDRKLSVTGAAFYYDYSNKQLRAKFVDPIFGGLDYLVNVPKSRVKGAELSVNMNPVQGLTLSGSVTYLDAQVTKYIGITGAEQDPTTGLFTPITASFKGASLPFAPKWQYSLRADYSFPLAADFDGYFGAGLNGQSKSIGILTVVPQDAEDFELNARATVDGQIGIKTSDGRWKVGVWGKNIFNKYYWTQANAAYDNIVRYTGRPAEYGLSVSFKY